MVLRQGAHIDQMMSKSKEKDRTILTLTQKINESVEHIRNLQSTLVRLNEKVYENTEKLEINDGNFKYFHRFLVNPSRLVDVEELTLLLDWVKHFWKRDSSFLLLFLFLRLGVDATQYVCWTSGVGGALCFVFL